MYLIVGLGNPGKQYAKTRHNAGFLVLDYFASCNSITINRRECLSRTGNSSLASIPVILAKPQTYMNLSGQAVIRLMAKYRVKPQNLVVVHDDLDLQPGQIRLRQGGSSAGHKGIESIMTCIGRSDFIRLKVGIGRPVNDSDQEDIINYVLGEMKTDETKLLLALLPRTAEALECLLSSGLESAMNNYNRSFTPPQNG